MREECKPFLYPECLKCSLNKIMGISGSIFDSIKKAAKILNKDGPVLIMGESGTGKELFAKSLHYSDCCKRKNHPFIAKNCGGIESSMLFNELFGHEKGAFTGALQNGKKGLFETAEGGTLFLDEIGDISLDMQVALLRAIEEKKHFRLGGTVERESDVRIIASTNKDIPRMVEEGRFRKDLFYRLNVYSLNITPIKDRKEDIIPLCFYFLKKLAIRDNVKVYSLTRNVMSAFVNYDWPGNVREMQNLLIREISYLPSEETILKNIPEELKTKQTSFTSYQEYFEESISDSLKERFLLKPLKVLEKEAIIAALKVCVGNRNQCCKILKISRNTLYRKIERYKISLNS
ncbi:MAG: sigma 54-interacting transcriptional regulator [Spirochaetota bacterium]|nr:sigma 54-interacting transcriptional regulator [Spirochaetota bacterium]